MHRWRSQRALDVLRAATLAWVLLLGLVYLTSGFFNTVVYLVGLVALLIAQFAVDPRPPLGRFINGPDDLDRPGGPYDRLHRHPGR